MSRIFRQCRVANARRFSRLPPRWRSSGRRRHPAIVGLGVDGPRGVSVDGARRTSPRNIPEERCAATVMATIKEGHLSRTALLMVQLSREGPRLSPPDVSSPDLDLQQG